jgi:hypothetical protein
VSASFTKAAFVNARSWEGQFATRSIAMAERRIVRDECDEKVKSCRGRSRLAPARGSWYLGVGAPHEEKSFEQKQKTAPPYENPIGLSDASQHRRVKICRSAVQRHRNPNPKPVARSVPTLAPAPPRSSNGTDDALHERARRFRGEPRRDWWQRRGWRKVRPWFRHIRFGNRVSIPRVAVSLRSHKAGPSSLAKTPTVS